MATFDLSELIEPLRAEINIPGEDVYDTVSNSLWITYLANGFWSAQLDGLMGTYEESEGEVVGDEVLPRDLQQLILMYTGIAILRQRLFSLQTVFRAKAGPVEYEVQQSAQVMKALLDEFSSRRLYLLQRLADTGIARSTYYIDTYAARQEAINSGYVGWIR